ncbi:MAG: hypothetical protein BCS36_01835 [Desulfovibrio sp. MES5]|uniref:hypothetical protein n=1 Tax=Desulfovibrio sp. MES5 TaxID=1899016 RepID=UPI000B9D05FC|nr:hypothetical protein [Desulfovibrio sp. MES5]OXS28090.1 MAG: hypothetical protein BCS36_01835 [Desulfovibrio sp. MES5]
MPLQRFLTFLLLALSLPLIAVHASAKSYELAFVTADIPDSCNFMTRDGALFVLDDEDHFFTVNVTDRAKDVSLQQHAENLSRSLKGGPISKVGDDGWGFTVKIAMVPFDVLVMADEKHVVELFTDLNKAEWPEDIGSAYASVKGKTPELAPLLHKILTAR